jgi:hypothetical protein
MYINNCSYKIQGFLFKPNKIDRDHGIDNRESDLLSDHSKNNTICLYISRLNIWYVGVIVW